MKKSYLAYLLTLILFSCVTIVSAQNKLNVKGVVIDAISKEPLIGVSVSIKGTTNGSVTDLDGKYTISCQKGNTLNFNYVGMEGVSVVVGNSSVINVSMKPSSLEIDEVVVVGYSAVKKSDLTGSVQTVKSEEFMKGQPVSIEQGLQGRLAGVNIVKNDGAPGGGISVQIRGTNSFMGSTEPLYVIDGVPISTSNDSETVSFDANEVSSRNALSFLDPNDIEAIEVLKDASATAIYGSRGSNGVVMITTKSGKKGKDKIELSANVVVGKVSNKLRMLGGSEYANYRNQAYINTQLINNGSFNPQGLPYLGGIGTLGYYIKGPNDYDNDPYYWQNAVFRTSVSQSYNVNYSGANEGGDYSIGLSYLNQLGTVVNSGYNRLSLNLKLNRQVRKWLKLGTITNLSTSNSDMIKSATNNQNNGDEGVIRSALYFPATFKKEDNVSYEDFQLVTNPVDYTQALNKNKNYSIYSSNYANVILPKGFLFRTVFSIKASLNYANRYFSQKLYEGRTVKGKSQAGDIQSQTFLWDNLLMYNRTFGKHNVSGTLGTSWESSDYYNKQIVTHGFGSDSNDGWILNEGTSPQTPKSFKHDSRLFSLIARAAYTYRSTYFLTATFRRDESSKFAKNNKDAYFPSVGIAWRVNNEKFLKNVEAINNLKVRYSYGTSGNAGIGPYGSLPLFISANYPTGGAVYPGYAPDPMNPGNANLKWETTYQHDVGIDLSVLNKFNIELDYYDKKTKDLIQRKELSPSTGFTGVLTNIGEVRNYGVELTANVNLIENKQFSWSVGGNFSINKNMVTSLGGKDNRIFPNQLWNDLRPFIIQEGKPIGQLYGFIEDGIWSSRNEVISSPLFQNTYPGYTLESNDPSIETIIKQKWIGEVKIKDLNGDGFVNDKDQDYIGNVNPAFIYAFNMSFRYRNIDCSFLFNGVKGNDIINMSSLRAHNLGQTRNVPKSVLDNAWTPERGGVNPKIYTTNGRDVYFTRRYIEDGSYLKLRNLSIGYTWRKPLKEIESVRFYATGNNLLTWTKYSGYDPEVNSFGSSAASRGVDAGGYPQSREFSFGINVTL